MVPFSQLRTSTDALSGTGLGLPLTDAMVTAHGGTLKLTSPGLGLGTTATIVVPVKCRASGEEEAAKPDLTWLKAGGGGVGLVRTAPPPPPAPLARVAVRRRHACVLCCSTCASPSDVERPGACVAQANPAADVDVLCVDDSSTIRRTIGSVCRGASLSVEEAADGAAAVAAMARRTYSLVTMDRQMPGMDGERATEAARAGGYRGPIVMVSGDVFDAAERRRLRALGITAFRPKLGQSGIKDVIQRLGELKKLAAASSGAGDGAGKTSDQRCDSDLRAGSK